MTEQPSPSPSAIRSQRYRDRKRGGVRVISVEVTGSHIRALMDNGLVSAAEPDVARGIGLLMRLFSAGVFRVDAERFYAAMRTAGVAPQTGHALRSPPV